MDKVESHIAAKRIARWPREWQEAVIKLTPQEQEVIGQLAVLANAMPVDEQARAEG